MKLAASGSALLCPPYKGGDFAGALAVAVCYRCGSQGEELFQDGLCWGCADSEYVPTPVRTNRDAAEGPCSNTGQNALTITRRRAAKTKPRKAFPRAPGARSGALIDYLSVTISGASELVECMGEEDFGSKLLAVLVGRDPNMIAGEFTGAGFQGYSSSALLIGGGGELVGKIGIGGNRDTVHVSLSGAGTGMIEDWARVQKGILTLGARITRCDIAWDDYEGELFNVRELHAQVSSGELRIRGAGAGHPPKTRFIDDHGHKTGCTLYAGNKGNKELCVYNKGQQLGDRESPWVRCEVRFYSRRMELPVAMLTEPLAYLRASYNVCEVIPADVCTRIKTKVAKVEACIRAMTRVLEHQTGKTIGLLKRSLGDEFDAFMASVVARPGLPARFKGQSEADVSRQLREAFGHVGRCNPLGAVVAA